MREVTIPVTFTLGTLDEVGLGGLKQTWISATSDGAKFSLTSGAGLGSSLLEASVHLDGQQRYASADIRELAQALWNELRGELPGLDPDPVAPPGGDTPELG